MRLRQRDVLLALIVQRDALIGERTAIAAERDAVIAERDALIIERDEAAGVHWCGYHQNERVQRVREHMEQVSRAMETAAEPLSYRAIEGRVPGKKTMIAKALAQLVTEGNVTTAKNPRNTTLHALARPYRDPGKPHAPQVETP